MADLKSTDNAYPIMFPLWVRMFLFSGAYFVFAVVGDFFSWKQVVGGSFWLPSGLFVAALLLSERRHWPFFILAALPASITFDLLHGHGLLMSYIFYCRNLLGAFAGACLVRFYVADRPTLSTVKEVVGVLLCSAVFGTIVSAVACIVVLTLLGKGNMNDWNAGMSWWRGDSLGVLLLTPLMLSWPMPQCWPIRGKIATKYVEAVLMIVLVLSVAVFVFWNALHNGIALKYVMIPVLMWVATRYEVSGIAIANLFVAMTAALFTISGYSDISLGGLSVQRQAIALQLYVAVVSTIGLVLAAVWSERKKFEAELREREERLRLAFDQSPLGGVIAALDGRFLRINAEMVRILGYSQEELGSKTFLDLTHPDYRGHNKRQVQRLLAGEIEQYILDKQYIRKDGSYIWVHVSVSLAKDKDGRPIYFFGAIEDITERKKMEEALRRSEQKFWKAFQSSPVLMAISTIKEGRFLEVNDFFLKTMGFLREEVIGRTSLELNIFLDAQHRADAVRLIGREGLSRNFECSVQTKFGELRYGLFSAESIEIDGGKYLLTAMSDITERKKAEEALRASEKKFRDLAEHSPNMIFINKRGRVVFANKLCCNIMKYRQAEFYDGGFDFLTLIVPEQRTLAKTNFLRHMAGGVVLPCEYTLITKEGERVDSIVNTSLIDFEGETAILGIVTVITDRKRAEEALTESEARYRRLLNSTTDYIYTVRVEDGRAVETVHGLGCVAVTGYTAEEYQSDPYLWYRMVFPDDRTSVVLRAAQALSGESPVPLEHRIFHQDGSLRWLRNTIVLHKDQSGKVVSYDGLVIDITERKHAEEEIRRGAALLKATLESTVDGILVVDGTGKILDFNNRFTRMWRLPPEIMNLKDDEKALAYVLDQLAYPEVFINKVRELYLQPAAESFDVLEFKDGRVFERYSRPLKIDDRSVGRVWSFSDVTEQKRAEAALKRAKDQAEASDRAKGEFLTNISHDFRTPLNAIAGFSSILGEVQLDDRSKKMLGIIQDKSQSLLTMTGDLLEASSIKSGKIRLRSWEFDFHKLMLDAVEVARVETGDKDIRISCSFDGNIPRLKGDPIRVEQIVANVLTNAVKYTENGEIQVMVACRPQPDNANRYLVRVSVKDTGLGIPQDKQRQIFEPFTRFHEFAVGKKYKGVGLGLHIAKTMVNLMGGEISVVSEVGKGSEFVFTLDLEMAS